MFTSGYVNTETILHFFNEQRVLRKADDTKGLGAQSEKTYLFQTIQCQNLELKTLYYAGKMLLFLRYSAVTEKSAFVVFNQLFLRFPFFSLMLKYEVTVFILFQKQVIWLFFN